MLALNTLRGATQLTNPQASILDDFPLFRSTTRLRKHRWRFSQDDVWYDSAVGMYVIKDTIGTNHLKLNNVAQSYFTAFDYQGVDVSATPTPKTSLTINSNYFYTSRIVVLCPQSNPGVSYYIIQNGPDSGVLMNSTGEIRLRIGGSEYVVSNRFYHFGHLIVVELSYSTSTALTYCYIKDLQTNEVLSGTRSGTVSANYAIRFGSLYIDHIIEADHWGYN